MDAQVASRITAAVAGVGNTFPQTPPTNGQVRAVDNHTLKQDPPSPHPSPNGPSTADMRKVIEKLPKGTKPYIKVVRTPEDLEHLKQWMTEHGTDIKSRYSEPGKGQWNRLPDGSEVGERYSAQSTGQNSLDIDLKGPDGTTEHWKIHINPKTGGVPDVPAVEPAPVEAAPAEPAPVESAPVKGFDGGGPAGIPVGPHFIHPPGSIDHGIPIIGEDDPWEDARDFRH
jgi:hypothetical protein